MKEANHHIISSFSWNTRFNKKDRAFELQERLSAYSKFNLQREIATVFDKVCPPDQTWKIPLLEVDLGVTEFNNLESELGFKLRKRLYEKIVNIIFYANQNKDSNIEIFTKEASQLEVLAVFLQSGSMPWNYQPGFGSVNQIIQYQLENNRQKLVELIRRIGGSHENVRKRIAWQIHEPNIIKIIEGLEPDNYLQVIDFSNELYLLQTRQNLVQTSTADFKKNLLCWALNFLLNERGTLFNKISFMKSSIRQMADHYNIRYEELFHLIELAVEEAGKKTAIKADFVLTIKVLSKENKVKIDKRQQKSKPDDLWSRLEHLLNRGCLKLSKLQRNELNELIVGLSKENNAKFRSFITGLTYNENDWAALGQNLGNTSLEMIFHAFRPGFADKLVECIYFLDKLGNNVHPRIEIKMLWTAGLRFLRANKSPAEDNQVFLTYCIADISRTRQVNYQKILGQFVSIKLPQSVKTDSAFSIYADLREVCFAGIADESPAFLTRQINELIAKLSRQFTANTSITKAFIGLKRCFLKIVQGKPAIALNALMEYPDKIILKKLTPYLFNSHMVSLLVSSAENRKRESLFLLADIAAQLNKNHETGLPEEWLNEKLMRVGLECLVINPQFNASKFITLALYHWLKLAPGQVWESGNLFIEKLTGDVRFQSLPISRTLAEKLKGKYRRIEKPFSYLQVKQFMKPGSGKQLQVSKILSAHFRDGGFENSRNNKDTDTHELINYLVPGSAHFMNKLIDEYTNSIILYLKHSSKVKTRQQVKEIFWKCLLDFTDHQGNSNTFRQSFRSSVLFRFPVPGKIFSRPASGNFFTENTNRVAALKGGNKIAPAQVFILIKKCFDLGTEKVEHDGQVFDLSELINIGLEMKPAELRKVLTASSISERSVELLRDNVSFSNFSAWIMHDTYGQVKDTIEAIRSLYDFVSHLIPEPAALEMQNEYWKQTWSLFKATEPVDRHFNKLAAFSFQLMARQTGLNAEFIQSQLNNKELEVNARLASMFARHVPGISKILSDATTGNTTEKDEVVEKIQMAGEKGLLNGLSYSVVVQRKIPGWFDQETTSDVTVLLNELVVHYPINFLVAVKNHVLPETQIDWLSRSLNFKKLCTSIGRLHQNRQSLLAILEKFYDALGKITLPGIPAVSLQAILFKKVLKAWAGNNWRVISIETIWNELIWDVCFKLGVSKNTLLRGLEKMQVIFPPALQVGLNFLIERQTTESNSQVKVMSIKPKEKLLPLLKATGKKREGIYVKNAGLVLLNSYFQMLFDRLDLLDTDKKFRDKMRQIEAVHYLQYVVTGLSSTEESLLPLNKIVCGLPLTEPVPESILISDENKKLINGLINAAIGYWPVIGHCSIAGFRGNWLVRDGLLTEQEDRWELVVEKRAYDILIHKSPFSFSIIKQRWMDKPIHVSWPC